MTQLENRPTQVTILGSGTCVPSLARSSCAVLVAIQELKLLLDIGPGTMRRLLKARTGIADIGFIFLSHFHPDHSGELASFLFASKYPEINRRQRRLAVGGGTGLANFYQGLRQVYGDWITLPDDILELFEFGTQGPDGRLFDGFRIDTLPVAHRPESLAYRITDDQGRAVVYSGDTDFSENLIELAADADLLICESALPDEMKAPGHLTPSLAGEIAMRARVRQLVLTHFYPECETVDIEKECRKTYAGPLVLAEDLLTITL